MNGISGIDTEKLILLCLISNTQKRKKIKPWDGGKLLKNTPRNEFIKRKKNL